MSRIYTIIFLLAFGIFAKAQNTPFETKKNVIEGGYNFWVYSPEPPDIRLPLIIFLHGASICGNNMERVLRYGTLDAIEKGKIIPARVVAPQNPGGAWSPRKINDMLEWMKANYHTDTTRVYVMGMSLGGYGTLDFATAYPEKIAAAMALCGGCSVTDVQPLGRLPLWIMHGTADKAVSVNKSKAIVKSLKDAGNDRLLRYDWITGGSHALLARVFYLQKTYDWLFSHSLHDNPRSIDKDFDITREDINQSYRELRLPLEMYEND